MSISDRTFGRRVESINTRMDSLDAKMDPMKNELRTETGSNKNKIKTEIRAQREVESELVQ